MKHEMLVSVYSLHSQAEMALESEGFVDIDYPTLVSVLSRETLNCKEVALFNAALEWAEAECCRQDLPDTPQNKRIVSDLLCCIK